MAPTHNCSGMIGVNHLMACHQIIIKSTVTSKHRQYLYINGDNNIYESKSSGTYRRIRRSWCHSSVDSVMVQEESIHINPQTSEGNISKGNFFTSMGTTTAAFRRPLTAALVFRSVHHSTACCTTNVKIIWIAHDSENGVGRDDAGKPAYRAAGPASLFHE